MILKTKNTSMEIDVVVFDKDGTLIGNLSTWKYIFNQYVATAKVMGYDIQAAADQLFGASTERMDAPLVTYYAKEAMTLMASAIWLSHQLSWPKCRSIAHDLVINTNAHLDRNILYQPNPGAVEVVKWLSQEVPVCIATSDDRDATVRMMKHLNIEEHISAISTSDEVEQGKPAPDILLKLSQELSVPAERMVLIGDNEVDAFTACNAHAKSIMVGHFHPQATDWVKDLQELLDLNHPSKLQ